MERRGERYIRRYATSLELSSISLVDGRTALPHCHLSVMDPWAEIVETGATPPVDIFPIFKWLPDFMSPWRKKALHVRQLELKLYGDLAEQVRSRRARGIDRECLLDKVFEMQAAGGEPLLDDEQVAYIGGVLLEGGSDTTSSLLLSFVLACCAFPEVLVRTNLLFQMAIQDSLIIAFLHIRPKHKPR